MTIDLRVLPAADWPAAVGAELADRLRRRPDLRLVLPTGDTPAPLYDELVALARAGRVSLAGATLIQLDEYVGLPAGDPARCDGRLRREIIDRLPDAPAAVHTIPVDELPPDEAAAAHDALTGRIDLALLGLGMNGHVGLNEPGSAVDSPTRAVRLAEPSRAAATARYGAGATPRLGVTLGVARLLAATEIWLLVTGERKARILARTLEGPESADCPASLLRRHPRLVVFADQPAASAIRVPSRSGRTVA